MTYQIFISHKMPTDTRIADLIGKRLVKYALEKFTVVHAGMFRPGEDFIERVKLELAKTNIFIWLYTGQDDDWSNCMFECGLFESNSLSDKLLIVLRRDDGEDEVPILIRNYNNSPVSNESVYKFIHQIYKEQPWEGAPKQEDSDLRLLASEIVHIFEDSVLHTTPYDLVPSFQIDVIAQKENIELINAGVIPPNSTVTGRQNWHSLFGRKIHTGDWTWKELTSEWPVKLLYEFELAKMMAAAIRRDEPQGCFLRKISNTESEMYRISLQTLSTTKDKILMSFEFSAAPIDLPFLFDPKNSDSKEFLTYQLVNISWYVRRRLIDQMYDSLLRIIANPSQNAIEIKGIVDDIRSELNNISVQTFVRGIDNVLDINDAIPELTQKGYAQLWVAKKDEIVALTKENPVSLMEIAKHIFILAQINQDFYVCSARAYAESAGQLSLPKDPNVLGGAA